MVIAKETTLFLIECIVFSVVWSEYVNIYQTIPATYERWKWQLVVLVQKKFRLKRNNATYSEKIFLDLFIQHVLRMCHIFKLIRDLTSYVLKGWIYEEKFFNTKLSFHILQMKKCTMLFCEVRIAFVIFYSAWILGTDFKEYSNEISWESVHWKPSCSVWTEGGMDIYSEVYRRFSRFWDSSNILKCYIYLLK
jgi:hypothetical protein